MSYKAFISYSHAADRKLAPALQQALQSFAKPFYRLRALKVFRDATDLRMTPELWPVIRKSLRESEFFILLASPESARSEWVGRAVEHDFALSERHYRNALAIIEQLSRERPGREDLLRSVAISSGKIGDVHRAQVKAVRGRPVPTGLQEAKGHWLRALRIYETLRARRPDDSTGLRHGHWQATMRLAEIHRDMGDGAAAKQYFVAAYDMIRDYDLAALSPEQAPDIASSLEAMSALSLGEGDLAAARSFGERAVQIRHGLAMYDRESFAAAVNLAMAHRQLGGVEEADGQYDRALTLYEAAAGILRRLPIDDPEHDRLDLRLRLSLIEERAEACRKAQQMAQSAPAQ